MGGRGIGNPDGLIATREPEDLAEHLHAWRVSLDTTAEEYQPVVCDHGQDVTAGLHMCPLCDPDRQRPAPTSADVEPDGGGVKMPEWVRQAREALEAGDRSAALALLAADETTPGGVTPSILEDAGIGAQNRA